MKVAGKVWVVTGAGSGMGRELSAQLLRRGARVAAVDRSGDALTAVAEALGADDRLSVHVLDITDDEQVRALPAAVTAAHGAVDGLINNAGIIQPFVPVLELDEEQLRRVIDVNLFGTLAMVRAFGPLLLERPQAHIANVSSMGGFFPFPGQTVYGASKAAVKLLTEGLYAELRGTRVGVSVILPGAVDTAITVNSGVEEPSGDGGSVPMTSAEKAATLIIEGIERGRLFIHVGTDAKLMHAAIRIAPKTAIGLVQRLMARRIGTPG